NSEELAALNTVSAKAVGEYVSNPAKLQGLINLGIAESLSQLSEEGLAKSTESNIAAVTTLAKAAQEGSIDAVIDRFSPEMLQESLAEFKGPFIETLRAAAAKNGEPVTGLAAKVTDLFANHKLDMATLGLSAVFRNREAIFKRMNTAVKAVANAGYKARWYGVAAAGVATADHFTGGHGATLAIDGVLAVWNWVAAHTVLQNMSYTKDMVKYSLGLRVGAICGIFALAGLAAQFSQFSRNKLFAIGVIKYGFSVFTYPLTQMPFKLFGRTAFTEAARNEKFAPRYLTPAPGLSFLPEWAGGGEVPADFDKKSWIARAFYRLVESKQGYADRQSREIVQRNRRRSVAGAVAIAAYANSKGVTPFEVLESLGDAIEGSAERRAELENLLTATVDLVTPNIVIPEFTETAKAKSAMATEVDEALRNEPVAFQKMFAELHARVDSTLATAKERPGLIVPYVRLHLAQQLLRQVMTLQEETYKEFANPRPGDVEANIIVHQSWNDAFITCISSSLFGAWGNVNDPMRLSYQGDMLRVPNPAAGDPDGALLGTNGAVVLNDSEQVVLHGALAASVAAAAAAESAGLFHTSGPATSRDTDRVKGQAGFFTDGWKMLKTALNFRESNPLEAIGQRNYIYLTKMLSGIMLAGMSLRFLQGAFFGDLIPDFAALSTQGMAYAQQYGAVLQKWAAHAFIGQAFFTFLAWTVMSGYRWLWSLYQTHNTNVKSQMKAMGTEFEALYLKLGQSIQQKDLVAAQENTESLLKVYGEKHLGELPADLKKATQKIPGENPLEWAHRVLEVAQKQSAVSEELNGKVDNAYTFTVCVVTTFLATFLMSDSFETRPFWGNPGADLSNTFSMGTDAINQWVNSGLDSLDGFVKSMGFAPEKVLLWKGLKDGNSMPLLITKSFAYVWAFLFTGRSLNYLWDKGQQGYRVAKDFALGAQNRNETTLTDAQLAQRAADAKKAWLDTPGVRPVLGAAAAANAVIGRVTGSVLGDEGPLPSPAQAARSVIYAGSRAAQTKLGEQALACGAEIVSEGEQE
ncbi:hypothetical protein K2X33_05690, partial [bacterium]|nr:hypothetical protein [bacterium]